MESSATIALWVFVGLGWMAGIVMLLLVMLFVYDIFQSKHAVLRNFPVVGHLRYFLEKQGEYFRQYFFAHDREELPFNRATRNWVYRTAKGIGGIVGFGSTIDHRQPGSIIFVSSAYPMLEEECTPAPQMVIGPDCEFPFTAKQIFNISGMSYGAISAPAVRALSRGAAESGVWMNTGEGGLSSYHLEGECDLIFQVGTAKYGVRDEAGRLDDQKLKEVAQHVKAFEIKISQGAKPGRGGVLPAVKVSEEVARIRGIPAGKVSSSPNRHREIKTTDDLLDMIARIRDVTGRPVGFKAVISNQRFPQSLFECIHRRGIDSAPDYITLDGGDGGTGAAPQLLMDHVGLSLGESLPMLIDLLMEADLKDRIKVVASGKLVTSADVAWALCVGADFVTSARGYMFALGCIQSLQCHQDTCPTGITTHNKRLQRGLVVEDKAKRVANYAHWVNVEVDKLAHSCGLANAREFRREHVRIVQQANFSIPLDVLRPYPKREKKPDIKLVN
ncbi:MAG: FMN-binding glutamate synthase family protein [Gammaproteobacteria bacterium]|nr:FMN-binding glutamate synthase family protein [Gammaproteobacteria bacterium]